MKISIVGNTYRLATYFNNDFYDFCGMCRAIMLNTLLLLSLCFIAGTFLGDLVATIASWVVTGSFFMTPSMGVIAAALIIILVLLVLVAPLTLISESYLELESIEVVKEFYRSKRNKYCPIIEYK